MADRLVQQDPRPARPEQHRHLASRGIDRVEIDDGLRQRLIDRAVPRRWLHQVIIEIAPADPEAAGFAAAILFDHDADVEPHQRAHIGRYETVGADDLDDVPIAHQRDRDLRNPRIARARGGVDRLAKVHLVGEGHQIERIGVGIEVAVGGARWSGLGRGGRVDQRHRLARAADRGGAQFIGVRKGGHLARHGAQAETRMRVVACGLQPPIVEAEGFGLAILQVQLAIIGLAERGGGERLRLGRVELAVVVEEGAGICWAGHHAKIGTGCAFVNGVEVSATALPTSFTVTPALCRGPPRGAFNVRFSRDRAGCTVDPGTGPG